MYQCVWTVLGSEVKNLPVNAEDIGWIPGLERQTPYRRKCNPLQHSCLRNHMDRGAWWVIAHGVARVRHDLGTKPLPS